MVEFSALQKRALEVQSLFAKMETAKYGRNWTPAEIAMGFVGDVGDLMKLVMAKSGVRDIADADEKLAHELADCLWSIFVLADKCDVDLEAAFQKNNGWSEKENGGLRLMPVIHFHYLGELTKEQKQKLASGMAQVVHDVMDMPKDKIQLWLHPSSLQDHAKGDILIEDLLPLKRRK